MIPKGLNTLAAELSPRPRMNVQQLHLEARANALEDCEARKKARPAFHNQQHLGSTPCRPAFLVRLQEELMKQSDDLLEEAKKYEKDRSGLRRFLKCPRRAE